jgi:hypothetical protein
MRAVQLLALCAALLVVFASAPGCFSPINDPGVCLGCTISYRPLTTAYAPLYNLALSYTGHDARASDEYATLFDSTRYEFVWDDPSEPGLDNTYGYDDEVSRTRRMFSDVAIASIGLTFLANAPDSVGVPSPVVGDPVSARLITINGISLSVDRPPAIYTCSGSCDFTVAVTDTIADVEQWRIIRWRDRTIVHPAPPASAPSAIEPTTWGGIKNLYR